MVEDRWVYATTRFTRIESSFQSFIESSFQLYDIYRDCRRSVPRVKQNVVKGHFVDADWYCVKTAEHNISWFLYYTVAQLF